MARTTISVWTALVIGLVGALSCSHEDDVGHGGHLVGGACLDHEDCVDRCVRGGSYPDGTCTVDCRDDRDCPGGTYCVNEDGGICLLHCGGSYDCRAGYNCKSRDRHGEPGDVHVCID